MNDPDQLSASEVRIRREIRAMTWPLAAAVAAVVGFTTTTHAWAVLLYAVFAASCLARWRTERPALPDEPPDFLAWLREHPWLFLLVVASAATLGIGAATVPFHLDQWWSWALLAAGVGLTAGLIAVLIVGRRNYDQAQGWS